MYEWGLGDLELGGDVLGDVGFNSWEFMCIYEIMGQWAI